LQGFVRSWTEEPPPERPGASDEQARMPQVPASGSGYGPPWRQPRGKSMVSLVNSHTNATRTGWHLWEIDLRFAYGLPPGWRLVRGMATASLRAESGRGSEGACQGCPRILERRFSVVGLSSRPSRSAGGRGPRHLPLAGNR